MREEYYRMIKKYNLEDKLSWVDDLTYSKRCEILKQLLEKYKVEIINYALRQYEQRYIRLHRIIPYMTKNILINLCKEYEKVRP